MQDIESLRRDSGVSKMLGYSVPSQRCVADFLEAFHDPRRVEQAQRQERLSLIPEETVALWGLGLAARGVVLAIAGLSKQPQTRATVDQDATIVESPKREAQRTYEGTRGCQPMVAVWAETEYYFRGDSACHESGLLNWLRDPERDGGPKGPIGFAVSARMSVNLGHSLRAVPEALWTTFATESDGTLRQWAELDFVPGGKVEKRDIDPLRYVGLRLLKRQGELFHDGNDKHYHAVITNRWEMDGGELLNWQRAKAGTTEHVHDEIKNGLGGGQLPSAKFGANAAWLRITCIAHNILVAVKRAWPDETLHNAEAKRVRFVLINVTGRFSRDRRKITLHLSGTVQWIKWLIKLFARFPLPTQPTG